MLVYMKAISSPHPLFFKSCYLKWPFQSSFNSFVPKAYGAQV